ncbi:MAG TPA: sugar phosphate nucleotidyltransferase, partial [Candidatus Polarisedimenticolia bacterium]|nr:sugar phosphate nucleotidyltransferase [Candidatus Polarisedimenticolia bacterium]
MGPKGNRWCIVLAAGDGTRLRSLTTDRDGVTTPKQYCSLRGDGSLLHKALARARRIAAAPRVVTVVAAAHRRWWSAQLAGQPRANVIVQPENRGTAPGLLLPLLEVLRRDPSARVVVLPSDHHVQDEAVLERAVRRGLAAVQRRGAGIVLMGIAPDAAVSDYGWIVPGGEGSPAPVVSFVEKPAADEALRLMRRGGVWNSFIIAGRARELLALFERRLRWLTLALQEMPAAGSPARERALACLYRAIEPADVSRDVLQGSEDALSVLRVPPCGWTDLGTPERVAACLERAVAPAAGAVSGR